MKVSPIEAVPLQLAYQDAEGQGVLELTEIAEEILKFSKGRIKRILEAAHGS